MRRCPVVCVCGSVQLVMHSAAGVAQHAPEQLCQRPAGVYVCCTSILHFCSTHICVLPCALSFLVTVMVAFTVHHLACCRATLHVAELRVQGTALSSADATGLCPGITMYLQRVLHSFTFMCATCWGSKSMIVMLGCTKLVMCGQVLLFQQACPAVYHMKDGCGGSTA